MKGCRQRMEPCKLEQLLCVVVHVVAAECCEGRGVRRRRPEGLVDGVRVEALKGGEGEPPAPGEVQQQVLQEMERRRNHYVTHYDWPDQILDTCLPVRG